jgi:hypothetical protein
MYYYYSISAKLIDENSFDAQLQLVHLMTLISDSFEQIIHTFSVSFTID